MDYEEKKKECFLCLSETELTTIISRELKKKRVYPNKFRRLVLTLASWYARMASVIRAKGWYTRVRTLEGW